MFGGGASLVYTPSFIILNHYFKKHLGLVNGFVTSGSSIFAIAMPHVLNELANNYGLQNTFFFLSGLTVILILSTLSFIPLMPSMTETSNTKKGCCVQIINVENWKNKKYFIWSFAIPFAMFGFFVPYVHIVSIIIICFNVF